VSHLLLRTGARPLAGGTDLLVQARAGSGAATPWVDLGGLPSLGEIDSLPDGSTRIGALVRLSRVITDPRCRRYPALVEGAATVGSAQVRSRATLVGNLCNASPAADTAPGLLVYQARAEVVGPEGRRDILLEDFWVAPGETALQPGEWVAAVTLPRPAKHGACYLKLGRTRGADLAVVGVAALVSGSAKRVAVASVAPTPKRLRSIEDLLPAKGGALPEGFAAKVAAVVDPIDDARASADYRRAMTAVLVARAWRVAVTRLGNEEP
jgi:CO/xanthine dehydrogenase FAD-binding subunit